MSRAERITVNPTQPNPTQPNPTLPNPTQPNPPHMPTWTHLTLTSSNAKTGPIPVSTTESRTCPPDCPFKASGCYAKSGPLNLHWSAVSNRERGMSWDAFCVAISALPEGQLWRHNQAGDLPGIGMKVNAVELAALVEANRGRRGYTYTHKYTRAENLPAIAAANAAGFTVNLSANGLAHADRLCDLAAGPVVTVLPADQTCNTVTPAGRRVVICPATQRDDVTCATCKLCARADRSVIVGFPAHGNAKRAATAISAVN